MNRKSIVGLMGGYTFTVLLNPPPSCTPSDPGPGTRWAGRSSSARGRAPRSRGAFLFARCGVGISRGLVC